MSHPSRWMGVVLLGALSVSSPAQADFPARLDHTGALGLAVDLTTEFSPDLRVGQVDTTRFALEVSPTWGLASGDELVVVGGLVWSPFLPRSTPGPYKVNGLALTLQDYRWGGEAAAFYRMIRGREEWKSFLDLGLRADSEPALGVGPAVDLGLQYELSPVVGAYLKAGASLEIGGALRAGFSGSLGIQGRTYLLDAAPGTHPAL